MKTGMVTGLAFALLLTTTNLVDAGSLEPPCFRVAWYRSQAIDDLHVAARNAMFSSSGAVSDSERELLNQDFQYHLSHMEGIGLQPSACLTPEVLTHIQAVLNRNALGLTNIDILSPDSAYYIALPRVEHAIKTVRNSLGISRDSISAAEELQR